MDNAVKADDAENATDVKEPTAGWPRMPLPPRPASLEPSEMEWDLYNVLIFEQLPPLPVDDTGKELLFVPEGHGTCVAVLLKDDVYFMFSVVIDHMLVYDGEWVRSDRLMIGTPTDWVYVNPQDDPRIRVIPRSDVAAFDAAAAQATDVVTDAEIIVERTARKREPNVRYLLRQLPPLPSGLTLKGVAFVPRETSGQAFDYFIAGDGKTAYVFPLRVEDNWKAVPLAENWLRCERRTVNGSTEWVIAEA